MAQKKKEVKKVVKEVQTGASGIVVDKKPLGCIAEDSVKELLPGKPE